jgi:ribosomal protein L35
MPKLKTRQSVAKRIDRITKTGKIMRRSTSAQHRTTGKSRRTLRQAKMQEQIKPGDVKKVQGFLPYA